jgi:hypothetical protein
MLIRKPRTISIVVIQPCLARRFECSTIEATIWLGGGQQKCRNAEDADADFPQDDGREHGDGRIDHRRDSIMGPMAGASIALAGLDLLDR